MSYGYKTSLRRQGGEEGRSWGWTSGYSGTGASAVYPLLACKSKPEWEMVATGTLLPKPSFCMSPSHKRFGEIDSTSLSCAQSNVSRNGLQDRIRVVQASSGAGSKILGPLFDPSSSPKTAVFDFTMCNPPFYSSHTEIQQSQLAKEEQPLQACSGSENEMIYPADPEAEHASGSGEAGKGARRLASVYKKEGGEVAFVARMVEESIWLGAGKCRWYTSMLGKLSSVPKLVDLLGEFSQTTARLSHLPSTHPLYKFQPQKTTLEYKLPSPTPSLLTTLDTTSDPTGAAVRVEKEETWMNTLERVLFGMQDDVGDTTTFRVEKRKSARLALDTTTSPSSDVEFTSMASTSFRVSVKENTWSRSARRKLKRKRVGEADEGAVPTLTPKTSPTTQQTKKKSKICNEPVQSNELQSFAQAAGAGLTPLGPPPRSLEEADDSNTGVYDLVEMQEYQMVCCIRLVSPSSLSRLPSSPLEGGDDGDSGDPDHGASDVRDSTDRNSTELGNALPCVLRFQWVYGFDRQMFEGFVSHVGQKVKQGS
ncbi:hypothetical protein H1R20_g12193, partial [Candolleomyces eurysporus]